MKQEFEHLFLVADPETLGEIRPQLHGETNKRLCGELAKTLANSTHEDIEKILQAQEQDRCAALATGASADNEPDNACPKNFI